jgi:hypothetical protein
MRSSAADRSALCSAGYTGQTLGAHAVSVTTSVDYNTRSSSSFSFVRVSSVQFFICFPFLLGSSSRWPLEDDSNFFPPIRPFLQKFGFISPDRRKSFVHSSNLLNKWTQVTGNKLNWSTSAGGAATVATASTGNGIKK